MINLLKKKKEASFTDDDRQIIKECSQQFNAERIHALSRSIESFKLAEEQLRLTADQKGLTYAIGELIGIECSHIDLIALITKSSASPSEKLKVLLTISDPVVVKIRRRYEISKFLQDAANLSDGKHANRIKDHLEQLDGALQIAKTKKMPRHLAKLQRNISENEVEIATVEKEINQTPQIQKRRIRKLLSYMQRLENEVELQKAEMRSNRNRNPTTKVHHIEKQISKFEKRVSSRNFDLQQTLATLHESRQQALDALLVWTENTIGGIQKEIRRMQNTDQVQVDIKLLRTIAAKRMDNLTSKARKVFENTTGVARVKQLPFEVFPKGEWTTKLIIQRLKHYGTRLTIEDQNRLEKIEKRLQPDECYIGKRDSIGYEGYVIFRFDDSDIAIAEKPCYGNATYLIKGSWKDIERILKLSKFDALSNRGVKRIIHREEEQWFNELKISFESWY